MPKHLQTGSLKTINGQSIEGSGDIAVSGSQVTSVNSRTGDVVLTKADVGLSNVDNTSDSNKPISTATQAALNAKQNTLVSGTSIKTVNGTSLLGSGDVSVGNVTGQASSVNGEIALFSGTTGKVVQRATTTGMLKASSGVLSAATAESDYVTPTGVGTLTNKTLASANLSGGYTESIFAVSGTTPALSPTNGSIQTWTLSGNSTPSGGAWAAGQSITLMIDDGAANTITWSSLGVTWKTNGGTAPSLNTSGYTVIALWKVGTTVFGARVGDA